MINGAHVIVYSKKAEEDRRFFRDVLKFSHVDVGGGWLIFALPSSEVAFHPGKNDEHEFYLMCEDVRAFIRSMEAAKIPCGAIHEAEWGSLTSITLPGGGKLGVYQPKHERPATATEERKANRPAPSRRRK